MGLYCHYMIVNFCFKLSNFLCSANKNNHRGFISLVLIHCISYMLFQTWNDFFSLYTKIGGLSDKMVEAGGCLRLTELYLWLEVTTVRDSDGSLEHSIRFYLIRLNLTIRSGSLASLGNVPTTNIKSSDVPYTCTL